LVSTWKNGQSAGQYQLTGNWQSFPAAMAAHTRLLSTIHLPFPADLSVSVSLPIRLVEEKWQESAPLGSNGRANWKDDL